jgi:hypothetical protein
LVGVAQQACWDEDADSVGDNWLFWRLRRLASPSLPYPAIELTGKRATIRGPVARLTVDGERFLTGESNLVELNGIDDWVCGVHLDSNAGSVWYHRDNTLVRG